MDIFDFTDYRQIIRETIRRLPKEGYGQLSILAKHIGVNSTLISQILSGSKNLSEEQGYKASEFFQFNEKETIYFLLLIQRDRAGHHQLKKLLEKQIQTQQREAKTGKSRVVIQQELTFDQQAVFYSDWLYTAIHTLSSIKRTQTPDQMSEALGISRLRIKEVTDWLIQHGLCKEEKGRVIVGPSTTYVDRSSSLATRHHCNWRQKAMESMSSKKETDFFFTAPFSISKKDYESLRKDLVQWIDTLAKKVEKTDPELMATINIDYFTP